MGRSTKVTGEKSAFAKNLSDIMEERKITHIALAEATGFRRQTIGQYCAGVSKPDTEGLIKIAKALGVSANWLLSLSIHRTIDASAEGAAEYTGIEEWAISWLRTYSSELSEEEKSNPSLVLTQEKANAVVKMLSAFIPEALFYAGLEAMVNAHASCEKTAIARETLGCTIFSNIPDYEKNEITLKGGAVVGYFRTQAKDAFSRLVDQFVDGWIDTLEHDRLEREKARLAEIKKEA